MNTDLYKIGATAKATGISVECLRQWERRYGIEPAAHVGRMRLYDGAQVQRLKKLKRLVDRGEPIRKLAGLTTEEIDRRLGQGPAAAPRVGLVGGELVMAERDHDATRLDVHGRWASPEAFVAQADALPALDVVALLMPSLAPEHIERHLDLLPEAALVVAYRYATEADLRTAQEFGVTLLQWPAPWTALEDACLAQPSGVSPHAPRQFTDEELLHIAGAAPAQDQGCIRALVDMVHALNAYVAHAARCEAGDTELPPTTGDAANARASLEASLEAYVKRFGLIHRETTD